MPTLLENSSYSPAFVRAVNRLLADEGGYADNSGDRGGQTKFGISKRNYPDLDVAALNRQEAVAIYYRDWWQRYGYSSLPGPIASKLFNLAVNIGPEHAVKCLQRALRACGKPLAEDGLLGPATKAAAAGVNLLALLAALRSEAAGYYRTLAAIEHGAGDNSGQDFLPGWLNRAYE